MQTWVTVGGGGPTGQEKQDPSRKSLAWEPVSARRAGKLREVSMLLPEPEQG